MEDGIRRPDESFKDKLIDDFQQNYMDIDPDLNEALEQSIKEYEEKIIQENINNHRRKLFSKLDIQLNYLLLIKDDYVDFFVDCFKYELNRYLNNECINIYLFKSHYDYLKKLINELYFMPIQRNKRPKIDEELYLLIEQVSNYC
jgi:hypothetical protein